MQSVLSLSLSLLLVSLSVNCAWGEVKIFNCYNPDDCSNIVETFNDDVEFHNVGGANIIGENSNMTFNKNVSFYADDTKSASAHFNNAGVMIFAGNLASFGTIANQATIILKFNNPNSNIAGDILNSANGNFYVYNTISFEFKYKVNNILGGLFEIKSPTSAMTTFSKDFHNQAGAILNIKSPTTFNYTVHNWDGYTQIGGIIIVESPTIVESWLDNYNNAVLKIKGTTLTVKNTFWNYLGATLIFSAVNGQLGQLIGNLTNQDNTGNNQGKVKVIVTGLTAGQPYQIITGSAILDEKDIEFIGGTGRYDGDGWIWIDSIFSNPEFPLNPNQQVIENALEGLMSSSTNKYQAITDTEKTIQKSFIAQPKNMLNAFKTDTLNTPLHSAYVSRLTASSRMIMNDSSNFINPLEKRSQTQFFATPFGGVLKGDELSGHLFGLSVGLTHISDTYITQGHFAYAKGQSTQDLTTQSTELNAHLFQIGGFTRLFYDKLETDINANFIFGKFELNNAWFDNVLLNSNSNFNNYQMNLGGVVGWRFGDNLSVKPFVGLQGYYEHQGEFKQESALKLTSKAYSSTMIDTLAGLEGRYILNNGSFIFAKASYENKLYNSHKEVFMRMANESLTYENETYDSVISVNIGARLLSTQRFTLDIEALYKHYDNELNYFGGNLGVKVSF